MNSRIHFLTLYDESAPSSRIRIYQFLPYFKREGYTVSVYPLLSGRGPQFVFSSFANSKNPFSLLPAVLYIAVAYFKRWFHVMAAWRADIVVVQKDVLPLGLSLFLRLGQRRIVYEFDDPIWISHPGAGGNLGWVGRFIAAYRKTLLIKILKHSSLVIVDNDFLHKFARKYCAKVLTLTSPIDTKVYSVVRDTTKRLGSFGWIGSPSSTYLLTNLLPMLEQLAKRYPFTLFNIGGSPIKSEHFETENIEWSITNEKKFLAITDVGLMPWDHGEFNSHRFGYKSVIYSCAGVPTLAPDIGINRLTVQDGITGVLYDPDHPDDFVEKAMQLLKDPAWRTKLGDGARKFAEKNHATDLLAAKYLNSVGELLSELRADQSTKRAA